MRRVTETLLETKTLKNPGDDSHMELPRGGTVRKSKAEGGEVGLKII